MLRTQQIELMKIMRTIPSDRFYNTSLKNLHQRYIPKVSYSTFRKYWKIEFKKRLKENNEEELIDEDG